MYVTLDIKDNGEYTFPAPSPFCLAHENRQQYDNLMGSIYDVL